MTLVPPPLEPWRVFMVLAGPFFGTLAATWAVAWPRLPRPLWGGSSCARCDAPVPLWRQVPLLSWALSKGSRGCCDGKIPWSYPLGEAAGVIVGLISGLLTADWTEGTLRFLLGVTLIYLSLVDLRRYVIPVQAIAAVAVLGMVGHMLKGDGAGLREGVEAAVVTAGAFEGLRRQYARARGAPGVGVGDGLLAAALAIWLGPYVALIVIIAVGAALILQITPAARTALALGWALSGSAIGVLSVSGPLH